MVVDHWTIDQEGLATAEDGREWISYHDVDLYHANDLEPFGLYEAWDGGALSESFAGSPEFHSLSEDALVIKPSRPCSLFGARYCCLVLVD